MRRAICVPIRVENERVDPPKRVDPSDEVLGRGTGVKAPFLDPCLDELAGVHLFILGLRTFGSGPE